MIASDFLRPGQRVTLTEPEPDAKGKLQQETAQFLAAAERCIEFNSIQSAMILMYSGIDAMAWLTRPPGVDDVRPSDFTHWVESYLLPNSGFLCAADDLYAARCGLLHSNTPESKRHRQGRACKVFYLRETHQGTAGILQLRLSEATHPFLINVDQFVAALRVAISRFLSDVERDNSKAQLVHERVEQCYFSKVRILDNSAK